MALARAKNARAKLRNAGRTFCARDTLIHERAERSLSDAIQCLEALAVEAANRAKEKVDA
jgi:hypothetical protein